MDRGRRRQAALFGRVIVVALIAAFPACRSIRPSGGAHATDSEVAAGERLYREGIESSGRPVRARALGDVYVTGAQAACVSCHRPSGLGSSEGGYYVPPINAPILFAPRKLDRRRLFPAFYYQVQPQTYKARLYQPHMRPGYTLHSLAVALKRGIDPAGHPLASIMPRYQLTDADVANLGTYLRTLSAHQDPGVDDQQIHLATAFSDQVPKDQRNAMLSTLQAYVRWHNLHLRNDRSRGTFSPYNRSEFVPIERRWDLVVWELRGPETTWCQQLEAQYQADPVLALIGGDVRGPWRGPAQFCDAHHLPCLFPGTELPAWPVHPYSYTIYFSAGLALEARVAAHFVVANGGAHPSIVQLASADDLGTTPAKVFQQALDSKKPALQLHLFVFHDPSELASYLRAGKNDPNRLLVLWPGANVKSSMDVLNAVDPQAKMILLPSRAIAAAKASISIEQLASRLRFTDPYELTFSSHAKSFETRAWMHARGLTTDHILLRFKAYYAMSLLETALFEIGNDFYRDYLIERMESESQKDMNPGMYPQLALGPGERFAAKVAEIVRLGPKGPQGLVPVSGWIAP